MAPISDKRITSPKKQQQPENIQSTHTPSVVLKEGAGAGIANMGGAQSLVKNALNHSHGLDHGHHNNQPHHHSNNHNHHDNHHHSQHAKENVSSRIGVTSNSSGGAGAGGGSKKGIEILDFHESWREEMEIYKDVMYVKKHVPQQLLGSHNHAHTPQGCQLDGVVNNVSANKLSHATTKQHQQQQHNNNIEYATHATKASSSIATGQPNSSGTSSSSNGNYAKRSITSENKARVRVATSMGVAEVGVSVIEDTKHIGGNKNQLHLKRPHEETPTKTAGSGGKSSSPRSAKRLSHSSAQSNGNSQISSDTRNASNNNYNANNTRSFTSPNKKIIVNQFHASSLLNGHHLEEKEKILTQNGLTNSSATANEASFYAANYLTPEALSNNNDTSNNMHGMITTTLPDNSNSIVNSLANNGNDVGQPNSNDHTDDDPCADIDNVTYYTDSDSEDEYTGHPFYLEEDGSETHQSKNIRYKPPVPENTNKNSKNTTSANTSTEPNEYHTPKSILSASLFPNVPPYLNFSSHAHSGPPLPAQLKKILKWKLSPVMPKIVKRVVLNSGFRIIKNTTDWMAVWDKHMKSPGFRTIRSHQKYNHMPGSFRIGRKDSMWRSIQQNMKKFGSKEFGFMQKSYVMPDDLEDLRQIWPKNVSRSTKWIVKPPASARGTGISIVNKWSQFPKDRPLVVQKYIERPLLINENKFDMRIYVVMTSINPLRLFMYKDGLARFASVKYSSELTSLDERCMHLTNYSINKFSENYAINEDVNACQGHKWTLQSLWCCLESRGVNTKRLWATLRNLVIKAIISGEAGLNRIYRQNVNFRYNCFELFGFDVLLDENLIPWLLEINISPSLHSELPLDLHVKGPLIQAILNTALYQVPPKLNEKQQNEILEEYKLKGPLCHDKRIFSTCLRAEEIRKHNHFTNRSIEYREEYLDAILDNLHPDDIRCLLITEDELSRCQPLERIFPTPDTYVYLKYIEHPRYYNRLLDAWLQRYGHCREKGLELLRGYCKDNYHLHVSEAALEKEPKVNVTDIDMLHVKKEVEDPVDLVLDDNLPTLTTDKNACDTDVVADVALIQSSQPTNNTSTTTTDKKNNDDSFKSIKEFIDVTKYDPTNNKSKQNSNTIKIKIKPNESTGKPKTEIKVS